LWGRGRGVDGEKIRVGFCIAGMWGKFVLGKESSRNRVPSGGCTHKGEGGTKPIRGIQGTFGKKIEEHIALKGRRGALD